MNWSLLVLNPCCFRRWSCVLPVWLFLTLLSAPAPVRGAEAGLEIQGVDVGIEGLYKTGHWTSVRVRVQGGGQDFRGRLTLTVPDGDGVAVEHVWGVAEELVIPAGKNVSFERVVKFGRPTPRVPVRLAGRAGDEEVRLGAQFNLPAALKSDREWMLSWGPSLGLDEAVRRGRPVRNELPIVKSLTTADAFPKHWLALEGVNLVALATSDLAQIDQIRPEQLEALRKWVAMGGKLLLGVGSRGKEIFGTDGRLRMFSPGEFAGVLPLRNTSPLETYTTATRRLQVPADGLPMTLVRQVHGKVELRELAPDGERPLMVRYPYGLGQVVFIALDLDQPPLAEWEGRTRWLQRALRDAQARSDASQEGTSSAPTTQFGYHDMTGQLRSALDQFAGVTPVEFSWVAGLLLLYIVLIGPLDYFVLRDLFKRLQWTWLSFPLAVAGFVLLAVMLNDRFRGAATQVNQVDLMDVDVSTATIRGTTWANLYSPASGSYDVTIKPVLASLAGSSDEGPIVSWHGLPGTALGGIDTIPAAVSDAAGRYEKQFVTDMQSQLAGVPVPVAATKSLLGRWWGTARLDDQARLAVDADGLLRGEVVNPLPVTLSDCMVLYENWVYRLDSRRGTLAPGDRTLVERERALNLQWRLSGRRVVDSKDVGTRWDQNTLAVDKILEMMMFHEAAGGEIYTHLWHGYQPYIDMTEHLRTGRAILVGRAVRPAAELQLNGAAVAGEGQHQSWTFCRIVFPVQAYDPAARRSLE